MPAALRGARCSSSRHLAAGRRKPYQLPRATIGPGLRGPSDPRAGDLMSMSDTGRFDLKAIAASFPESAQSLLLDHYLTDTPQASARVFRVYKPTPPHYHAGSDEYLYVLS